MDPAFVFLIFAFAVVLVPLLWLMGTYNGLVRLRNACDESWSSIDAQLQRRYDLIPNLVETVRGFAQHERETFERVVEARSRAAANHGDPESQAGDENTLVHELRRLFILVEQYPTLKSDAHFLELQRELSLTEDRIARARRFYNTNVRDLNIRVDSFPANLVASPFGFQTRQYFEIEDHVRVAPVVDLNANSRPS